MCLRSQRVIHETYKGTAVVSNIDSLYYDTQNKVTLLKWLKRVTSQSSQFPGLFCLLHCMSPTPLDVPSSRLGHTQSCCSALPIPRCCHNTQFLYMTINSTLSFHESVSSPLEKSLDSGPTAHVDLPYGRVFDSAPCVNVHHSLKIGKISLSHWP